MYSVEVVRTTLPKVGDVLRELPFIRAENTECVMADAVVVYVNRPHLFYVVEFPNGVRESYKVPHHAPRRVIKAGYWET